MQLDLMMCDHAQVSGNKLFASGAGINRIAVSAGAPQVVVSFAIAGVLSLTPDEATDELRVTFELRTADDRIPAFVEPDGFARPVAGEMTIVPGPERVDSDQAIPFAFNFNGVPLANLGGHFVVVAVNDVETRRLGFVIEAQA